MDPKSTLNTKKQIFRIDPKTKKKIGEPVTKRPSKFQTSPENCTEPSFIELLKRNGFLVDDSVKSERKRPWHLPKVKTIEDINDN